MILLYSSSEAETFKIAELLQHRTSESVVISRSEDDVIELARLHRPQTILLFGPGRTRALLEIQSYLREILRRSRVRILPSNRQTHKLLYGWDDVINKALKSRREQKMKVVKL